MTTDQVLQIIGGVVRTEIIAGQYGDASLHANEYVTADPCYIFANDDKRFNEAAIGQQSAAYSGTVREWVEIEFLGRRAFFITCSDGVGPLNHCVDAGWVAAIPLSLCPDNIKEAFTDAPHPANN